MHVLLILAACSSATNHYLLVEERLLSGDIRGADHIVEEAEADYGVKSRVLYYMDRGMTLHLAGQYQASNSVLEQAELDVEHLYTRRVRTEAAAFLTSDANLSYEGDAYEQTMINVVKALNYAVMENWNEALVEARRLDHRLNVLKDRTSSKDGYRDDAFARYLSGLLYEIAGDLNNAFIAYRNAYEEYRAIRSWSHTPVPPILRADLLRMSEALHLEQEQEKYRREFSETIWRPYAETQPLAHVVVVTYNGRAPRKEDLMIDVPVSLDALRLVLLTKLPPHSNSKERRAVESVLYGLNGHIARIAIPTLVPQKTRVRYATVDVLSGSASIVARSELMHNLTAVAERTLSDQLAGISVKAVARAVTKYALADGMRQGAKAAVGSDKNAAHVVGFLVGALAHAVAIASEEADTRSWRTLPDEIHVARLWLPAGTYELRVHSKGQNGEMVGQARRRAVTLRGGETMVITERVLP